MSDIKIKYKKGILRNTIKNYLNLKNFLKRKPPLETFSLFPKNKISFILPIIQITVKKRFQQKIVFQLMFETHFIYSKLLPVLRMKKNE